MNDLLNDVLGVHIHIYSERHTHSVIGGWVVGGETAKAEATQRQRGHREHTDNTQRTDRAHTKNTQRTQSEANAS